MIREKIPLLVFLDSGLAERGRSGIFHLLKDKLVPA